MVYRTAEPPSNLPSFGAENVENELLDLTDEIWEVTGTLRELISEFGEKLTTFLVKLMKERRKS